MTRRDQRLPDPYPLYWPEDWKRTKQRKASRYQVDFTKARNGLVVGVRSLASSSGFVSRFSVTTNVPLRVDGLPLSGQREPHDPGVAVWWLNGADLRVIACDQWRTVRENMRAVGLAVDALRSLERCGASQIMERAMQSFDVLAISAGKPWWVHELGLNDYPASVLEVDVAFKGQVVKKHPDKGGTHEGFLKLQDARGYGHDYVTTTRGAAR